MVSEVKAHSYFGELIFVFFSLYIPYYLFKTHGLSFKIKRLMHDFVINHFATADLNRYRKHILVMSSSSLVVSSSQILSSRKNCELNSIISCEITYSTISGKISFQCGHKKALNRPFRDKLELVEGQTTEDQGNIKELGRCNYHLYAITILRLNIDYVLTNIRRGWRFLMDRSYVLIMD